MGVEGGVGLVARLIPAGQVNKAATTSVSYHDVWPHIDILGINTAAACPSPSRPHAQSSCDESLLRTIQGREFWGSVVSA